MRKDIINSKWNDLSHQNAKIDWLAILRVKNDYSLWTQHIMEHREAMLDPDQDSVWAQNILGIGVYTIEMRD